MSEFERNGLVVIQKSSPKRPRYGNGYILYVNLYDFDQKQVIRAVIPASRSVRMYAILDLQYNQETNDIWKMDHWREIPIRSLQTIGVLDEDQDWSDFTVSELPTKIFTGWKSYYQVVGQFQKEFGGFYRFRDCTFYNGYLETPDGLKVRSGQFSPPAPMMGYFNNINDENSPILGGFEAKGKADLVIRQIDGIWKSIPRLNGDTDIKVFNYELSDLKEVTKKYEADKAYKQLIAWARRKLDDEKKLLSRQEIVDKATELGIEIDGDEFLTEVCFRPEYQKSFFKFFRELATETFYSEKAFFFILKNGVIAWEKPEYGSSTYLFETQDLQKLWDYLAETPRSAIVSDERVQTVLKFIGRRKHPQANEDEYVESWQKDIKDKAGL